MRMRAGLGALSVTVLWAFLAPAMAGASGLDVRVGAFLPTADSGLFDDDADLYLLADGGRLRDRDWAGVSGGLEYSVNAGRHLEIGVHVDGYERTLDTAYREFVRDSGREIEQRLRLTTAPVGLTVRFVGGSRHSPLAPYVGVGVDAVVWKYEEWGDFIDFYDDDLPVFDDAFESEGVTGGLHLTGGVRMRLNDDFAFVAEGRYLWAKDDMGDDFRGNRIDLGGWNVTAGLHVRF